MISSGTAKNSLKFAWLLPTQRSPIRNIFHRWFFSRLFCLTWFAHKFIFVTISEETKDLSGREFGLFSGFSKNLSMENCEIHTAIEKIPLNGNHKGSVSNLANKIIVTQLNTASLLNLWSKHVVIALTRCRPKVPLCLHFYWNISRVLTPKAKVCSFTTVLLATPNSRWNNLCSCRI